MRGSFVFSAAFLLSASLFGAVLGCGKGMSDYLDDDGGITTKPTPTNTGTTTSVTPTGVPTPTGTPTGVPSGTTSADCPLPVAPGSLPQGWKPPLSASNVCSGADIAAFKAALADQNGTDATLKASVTGACNACIFSKQTDASWTPLVDYDDGSGTGNTVLIVNQGACYAGAPNGTAACGQAYFDEDNCLYAACPQDQCPDQSSCAQASLGTGGACDTQNNSLNTGCGSALMSLTALCDPSGASSLGDDVLAQVQVLCGNGPVDAGGG